MGKSVLVILAAGRGRRLSPFTDKTPKALIEFEGKTITEMTIEAFSGYIGKVVIVVGHHHEQIRKRIGTSFRLYPSCARCRGHIVYVHNRAYERTGAATSLSMAKHHWAGKPCVIMEGDHLFHPRLAGKLMGSVHAGYMNCVLVDIKRPIAYDEEVLALDGPMGLVKRLMWPASDLPKRDRDDVIGEALAIFKLSASASASLAARLSGGEIIEYIDMVFARRRLHYLTTMGLPWIEIDTPEDLERAQVVYEQIKEIQK